MIIVERTSEIEGESGFGAITTELGEDNIIFTQDNQYIYIPRARWRELVRDVATLMKMEGAK